MVRWIGMPCVGALILVGCGGAQSSRFPTPEELQALQQEPAPPEPVDPNVMEVERWTLTGPFPARGADEPPSGVPGAEAVLEASAVKAGRARASAVATCIAREVGRFVAVHDKLPADPLRAFIASRCGSPTDNFGLSRLTGEVGEGTGPAQVGESWSGDFARLIDDVPLEAGDRVGAALVVEGGRAVYTVAWFRPAVEATVLTEVPDAEGRVRVAGRLLVPAEGIEALVTRGRFEYAECEGAPDVRPPHFDFVCPVDPADASARVEVVMFLPDAVLGEEVVGYTVWPGGAASDEYVAEAGLEPRVFRTDEELVTALAEVLNPLRAEAGRGPLRLAPRQSEQLAQLAPHYWASISGKRPRDVADRVALGVLAGWKVDGTVMRGRFASASMRGAPDAARLVEALIASPFHRRTLFATMTTRLAVGPFRYDEARFIGVLVGTYETLDDRDREAEVDRVWRAQAEARRAQGVEPHTRWRPVEARRDEVVRRLEAGELDPGQALSAYLDLAAEVYRGGVRGYVLTTSSLEDLEIPREMVVLPWRKVAVAVGVHRDPGHPWGRYVVLMVWPDDSLTAGAPGLVAHGPARPEGDLGWKGNPLPW